MIHNQSRDEILLGTLEMLEKLFKIHFPSAIYNFKRKYCLACSVLMPHGDLYGESTVGAFVHSIQMWTI